MYKERAEKLQQAWETEERWKDIKRPYSAEDVIRLRGSLDIEHTLAKKGSEKLWNLINTENYVNTLGALTGNQAVQQVRAGLKAIYLSGWQVAADANMAGEMYPDQSLYPVNSVPQVVRRINKALQRADQVEYAEGELKHDWFAPIVADAEAGFGGHLNVFELMKSMIEAGASAVHFEDQLASEKKCGHLGGKVLLPTQTAVKNLVSARFAADVMGTPTVIMARTDANAADLITSDVDEADAPFITGERTVEGFYRTKAGIDQAIARGLSYAPYADLLWCETAEPDLKEAQEFADAIRAEFPDQLLAYNCSPSFNWSLHMSEKEMDSFQKDIAKMGYKFQFVTLAGFHTLNYSMFELAEQYKDKGMGAYSRLVQSKEFAAESKGFTATRHQREVGTGYFDEVAQVIAGGESSTVALAGSTEADQFK